MIKLIAIDLDGSLLTDQKQLPPDFWDITDKLIGKGVNIAIASGRPFHNISSVLERLKDDLYFISDNGTYMVYREEDLLVNTLDKNSIDEFLETVRGINYAYPVVCGKDMAFVENSDKDFMAIALKYYQEYKVVEDLKKVEEPVLKLSLCDLIDSETNCYPHYKKYEQDFSVAVSGKQWLDITNLDGTKGNAISTLQKKLNVLPEETLAFGDFLNDLDMVQNAGYGYAMKNAHPELRSVAKFVTEYDNNHFGVTKTIKELFSV